MIPFIRSAAIALLAATALLAQTQPTPQARISAESENAAPLNLSLESAITTTVQSNLGVHLDRYDYRISGQLAQQAYAPFDWFTQAQLSTSKLEQPSFAIVFPSSTERTGLDLGLQHLFSTGATFGASFNNNLSNDDRFQASGVEDVYGSDLGFSFNQPLLRNFGVDVNRRGIYIARNNLNVSGEQFRNTLMIAVLEVEQAYWDLVYTRQELEVRRASVALAKDQERITQIRIDVGASAPLDILQPRVAIATREEDLILVEAAILDAEDRLRRLMNLPPAEWDRPIVPTDTITFQPASLDIENGIARAMERRPEVKQIELLRENNRVQYVWARNQVLPRLDFRVDYGLSGEVAGSQIVRDPVTGQPIGTESNSLTDSLQQVFGFDYPGWTVGVNFGLPIRNIGARAESRRAELDLDRAETEIEYVRRQVALEVRAAARDLDTAYRSITQTSIAGEAALRNLEAERKRFENGMTTNFNVLLIQQDLADAKSREIRALAAYKKAVANFHRAVGDNLDVHNIAVEMPEKFDLPDDKLENVDWLQYRSYAKDLKDGQGR